MFERFTDEARAVVVDSQLQARRLGHHYLGCEHLLLSIASTDTAVGDVLRDAGLTTEAVEAAVIHLVGGPASAIDRDALAAIGIDLDLVRSTIEATFGPNAWAPAARRQHRWLRRDRCEPSHGAMPLTCRAKKCLEMSLGEARGLGRPQIGVEHIALALTGMSEGLAPGILSAIGVSASHLRTQILDRYRQAG